MKIWQYIKAFLGIAVAAAPVAEAIAKSTGHEDVTGDIRKAGEAASAVTEFVSEAEKDTAQGK